jgi:hemerythrin
MFLNQSEGNAMTYMQWSIVLDTGISVIDKQHRRIVEYINTLYDAHQAADNKDTAPILGELIDYTMTHFAFEESLMEEGGYPYLKAHKRVHHLFTKKVGEYVARAKAGEDVTAELLEMLKRWLFSHIKNDDADYVESAKQVARIQAIQPKTVLRPMVDHSGSSFASAVRRLFA